MKGKKDSKLLVVDIFMSTNKKVKCQQKKFQKFAMKLGKKWLSFVPR